MKRIVTTAMVVLVLAASATPAAATAAPTDNQEASGYAGAHVSFETSGDAITDYAVDGETVLSSVSVQSQSAAESSGRIGADASLSAVTNLDGSAVSIDSETSTSASLSFESGAEMEAHDNSKGIFLVEAGDESQYVSANLSSSAEAQNDGEKTVVVNHDSGADGAFVVIGEGSVMVNDEGDVTADLAEGSALTYRSYADGRTEDDEKKERLISNGKAAAEVTVSQAESGGSDLSADVVEYSEDTTVTVTNKGAGTVEMTAERSSEQGRIVMTTVSEQAFESAEDVQVAVDGEAAAEASAYSELESAIQNGEQSRYMVTQSASASASADVLVAVNQFSERTISMTEDGDGSDGSSDGDDSDSDGDGSPDSDDSNGSGPGFTLGLGLLAVLAGALVAARRR
jgi:hypothetical protein